MSSSTPVGQLVAGIGTVGTVISGAVTASIIGGNVPVVATVGTIQSANVSASIIGGNVPFIGTIGTIQAANISVGTVIVGTTIIVLDVGTVGVSATVGTILSANVTASIIGGNIPVVGTVGTILSVVTGNIQQWNAVIVTAAAALGDAMANPTAPLIGAMGLAWNGTTFTRLLLESAASPNLRVGIYQGGNETNVTTATADALADARNRLEAWSMLSGFNGTTWDRLRTMSVGDNVAATGIMAAGMYAFDGSFARRIPVADINADGQGTGQISFNQRAFGYGFNSTTWDRLRTVAIGDNTATGILAIGDYSYSEALSNWSRQRQDVSGRQVGVANTNLIFTITTRNARSIQLHFASSGGNFASQNANLEGSADNTNFTPVVNIGLGTTNSVYQINSDATLISGTNFALYPYIRVTVPALGVGITAIVTYGAKQ